MSDILESESLLTLCFENNENCMQTHSLIYSLIAKFFLTTCSRTNCYLKQVKILIIIK